MKAYTDLDQSKKLAEILPSESADAFYPWRELIKDYDSIYVPEKMLVSDLEENDILAWSLVALSAFILSSVVDDDGNNYKFYLSKDGLDRWIAYYKSDDVSIYICEESHNMIDVIFEMVCWLKTEKYI